MAPGGRRARSTPRSGHAGADLSPRRPARVPKRSRVLTAALLLCGLAAAGADAHAEDAPRPAGPQAPVRIAFMPDVHFHDVHATFEPGTFDGVLNPRTGRRATIRTMQAQLTSTRLFNENAFAFLAALDDAVARGVRIIALPGDFSDDGQPVHMRGLVRILDDYAARHGVEFFAVPGNHDPVRPFDQPGGKPDYLGRDPRTGRPGPVAVYSAGAHAACDGVAGTRTTPDGVVHCTDAVRHLGHAGITAALAGHGFMPKPQDRYYATPYSTVAPDEYAFARAREQAQWSRRASTVCNDLADQETPRTDGPLCARLPDASYVVEPVEGLWLVGLDANVYLPTGATTFSGSGNHGYDRMLRHKPHVITWLADVVARGAAEGKQVVAFSHFPMGEFFNGASDDIARLLGAEAMQLARRPADTTTGALARTGLRVHVGGHMHLNDIAVHRPPEGHTLFNIQTPSLAAYVPAYTLMTVEGADRIEVETIRVSAVPRFDEFFDLYREEHAASADARWDPAILDAGDYRSFARHALTELVRLRLLDSDWPCDLHALVQGPVSGADLLVLSQLPRATTLRDWLAAPDSGAPPALAACLDETGDASAGRAGTRTAARIESARRSAARLAGARGLTLGALADWTMFDLAVDMMRLANAGDLALDDIPAARLAQYALLAELFSADGAGPPDPGLALAGGTPVVALVRKRIGPLLAIVGRLSAGAPTAHVRLDLARGEVVDLSHDAPPPASPTAAPARTAPPAPVTR